MKCCNSIATMIAVGAVAYLAGRLDWPASEIAHAQSTGVKQERTKQAQPPEMDPATMKMMEAMQMAGEVGDAHKRLNAFAGDWKMEATFVMMPGTPPMNATATVHREWVLDGHFLQETVEGHAADMPETFRGIGYLGFNNVDGVYEMAWMENMSTGIMTESGFYDEASKTFHFRGLHRDPASGRMVPTRSTLDVSDPNRHVFVSYAVGPDGGEFKSMDGWAQRIGSR